MNIVKFDPTKAEIQAVVLEVEGLTITGVDDVAGYEAVKAGKKKLADYRITITKYGKGQREEALAWQREVLRQEKELLAMIEPTEAKLKGELEEVDEARKIEERKVLLPSRIKMLEEVGVKLLDAEILSMDEVSFSSYFTEKKMQYLEMQENKRKQEEEANRRAEEIEQAKTEAAEKAVIAERERVEKEKAEHDMKMMKLNEEIQEKARKKMREEELAAEAKQAEQERIEKNRRYKAWLKTNGYTEETQDDFIIKKSLMEGETSFTLYKKIDSIIIK